jgi:hypothetical protein
VSRLRRVVLVIVLFRLLGLVVAWRMSSDIGAALTNPYTATFVSARDSTDVVQHDVTAITQELQATEQAGTPIPASDRLALAQARLAVAANALAIVNYAVATYALFAALWVGLLGLALAVAIAIAA